MRNNADPIAQTLFRVWDVFFIEGPDVRNSSQALAHADASQTLYRVAVAILKLSEGEILSAEGVSELFSCVSGMTSRLWAADKLIQVSQTLLPVLILSMRFENGF
jgi:hypothetical protein